VTTPTRVILAEDDALLRAMMAVVCRTRGYEVEACADGAEAWARFEAMPAAILVLDWQMPGLDGLEVCRRVRQHPAGAHAYALVVTMSGGSANLERILEAGADDYLAKAFAPTDLDIRLRIAERRMTAAAAHRTAEEELREARYLAGIGELSLALQHEINNPLASLLMQTALLRTGTAQAADVPQMLATVDMQARRVAEVVRRLAWTEAPRAVPYAEGKQMIDLAPPEPS